MSKNDGGPAYPMISWKTPDGMVTMQHSEGMTLRDWFAGQALAGMTTRQSFHAIEDAAATQAYAMADAMISERDK